jgi:hypothetical protein
VTITAPSHPAGSEIPRAAAQAHAALLKHTDLQFDFPGFKPPPPPPWLVWLIDHLFRPLAWLLAHPTVKYFFWTVLIGAIGLGLFFVIRAVLRRGWLARRPAESDTKKMEAWRPTPEKARLLLEDADALAAAGRFADAIHLILLRSVVDISERRPELLKPALTSREIGSLAGIPEAARRAFVAIARVVERAVFASRPVGQEDYAACRAEYERFAIPDPWLLRRAA